MTDAATFLDASDESLAPLERALQLAEWDVQIDANDEHEQTYLIASRALDATLSDTERHAGVVAVEKELATAGGGSQLRRRATLLRAQTTARQRPRELSGRILELEASLGSLYSTHRGQIDARPVSQNEIDNILRDATDAARRQAAWEASKSIGPLAAPLVRELAGLRNEAARHLGFRDHFAMSLALDELDEAWLFDLLDRLDADLGPTWTTEKAEIDAEQRSFLGLPDGQPLRPWDYSDAFFQDAPPPPGDTLGDLLLKVDPVALSTRYFETLGDRVDSVIGRSDLYPRERKAQQAFCMSVDRGDDVRVLANVEPGVRWLTTMLHELGHAAYDVAIDPALPWSLRSPAHVLATEAIAMLHGRRSRDAAFLERFAGFEAEQARNPINARVMRRDLLVFVPWVQVMTRFEQRLYADPNADLGAVWWALVERFQLVSPPPGDRSADWASKLHLALAPVYYQNYLLGEILASQLEAMLQRETGSPSPAVNPARAGAILRERLMQHGAAMRWDALVEQATGEPLTTDHLVAALRS